MPEKLSMLPGARNTFAFAILLLAGSSAFAQPVRYELFPEPDVRRNATNRVASLMSSTRKTISSGSARRDTLFET